MDDVRLTYALRDEEYECPNCGTRWATRAVHICICGAPISGAMDFSAIDAAIDRKLAAIEAKEKKSDDE